MFNNQKNHSLHYAETTAIPFPIVNKTDQVDKDENISRKLWPQTTIINAAPKIKEAYTRKGIYLMKTTIFRIYLRSKIVLKLFIKRLPRL